MDMQGCIKIESDTDLEIYRLVAGGDDDPGRLEGAAVNWGEEAFLHDEPAIWKAYISAEGNCDGFAYRVGGGEACALTVDELDMSELEAEAAAGDV